MRNDFEKRGKKRAKAKKTERERENVLEISVLFQRRA